MSSSPLISLPLNSNLLITPVSCSSQTSYPYLQTFLSALLKLSSMSPLSFTTTWIPLLTTFQCHRLHIPTSVSILRRFPLTDMSPPWMLKCPLYSNPGGFFFFFLSLSLFKAAPAAHRSSPARGRVRATAAGLHHSHSNARSELHPQPML